jgi:hypothetical protein
MTHLLAEQFQMHAGLQLIHVPYKGGGPALNDMLAGHIPVYFDALRTSASQIQANKLRGPHEPGSPRIQTGCRMWIARLAMNSRVLAP